MDYAAENESPYLRPTAQGSLSDGVQLFRNHEGNGGVDNPAAAALVDHVSHGTGMLEGYNAKKLIKNSQVVINPCVKHPY